jgi:cyclopropane fatty-acyl-phospholipid synthase-like methyltransferase
LSASTEEQLDEELFYPELELQFFEKIWGKGFISPGGPQEVAEILQGVDLKNKRVLDIGCGMGGIDILLAQEYDAAKVIGIDVEKPVLDKANKYILEADLTDKISCILVDPGPFKYKNHSFDVVFSKDALLHIPDKKMLFSEIFRVLKPNGLFVAGDWLGGKSETDSEHMEEFHTLTDNEFDMVAAKEYEMNLVSAGFGNVSIRDRNKWYLNVAKQELKDIQALKDEIIDALGQKTYEINWELFWKTLIETLETGEFRPTHIKAIKEL